MSGLDSTRRPRQKYSRTRNLAGTTEKSGAMGAFGKAGRIDIICIPLRDVGPTAEKLYLSDIVLEIKRWPSRLATIQ